MHSESRLMQITDSLKLFWSQSWVYISQGHTKVLLYKNIFFKFLRSPRIRTVHVYTIFLKILLQIYRAKLITLVIEDNRYTLSRLRLQHHENWLLLHQ